MDFLTLKKIHRTRNPTDNKASTKFQLIWTHRPAFIAFAINLYVTKLFFHNLPAAYLSKNKPNFKYLCNVLRFGYTVTGVKLPETNCPVPKNYACNLASRFQYVIF